MNIKTMMMAVAALAIGNLSAKSILWYRFDECGKGGTRATGATVIANQADPGNLVGKAHSYSGTTLGTDASLMPYGTATIASPLRVCDPVSARCYEDESGMHFGLDSIPGTTTGQSGSGAAVVCDWDEKLALSDITVEAIFRVPQNISQWTMAPIVIMTRDTTQATWSLQVNNGKVFHRATLLKSGGSTTAVSGSLGDVLNDGKWHHVAMTFKASEHRYCIYIDHKEVKNTVYDDTVGFEYKNGPLVIGANTKVSNRTFVGDIDEVRISDTALSPEEMLTVGCAAATDPDVLVYMPFEHSAEELSNDIAWEIDAYNCASNKSHAVALSVKSNPPKTLAIGAASGSVPAGKIYEGCVNGLAHDNTGSYQCLTNVPAGGACLLVSDPTLQIPSRCFTLETFLRCEKPLVSVNPASDSHVLFDSSAFKILVNCQTQKLFLRTINESGTTKDTHAPTSSPVMTDGAWHHVALVYDAENKVCSLYADYECVIQDTVTLRHDYGTSGKIYIGSSTGLAQFFNGWLDEVRLTARALGVKEFLNTKSVDGAILAWYDFEDDLSVKPLGAPMEKDGVIRALTDGGSVTLDQRVWGAGLCDAEGEVVRAINAKSLRIDRGAVVYPRNAMIEVNAATVEMFLRPTGLSGDNNGAWASVVGLHSAEISDTAKRSGKVAWQLRYGDGASPRLHAFFQTADKDYAVYYPAQVNYLDSKWHHVAFSFAPNSDGPGTVVKLYWDYDKVVEQVIEGEVNLPTTQGYLELGLSVVAGRLFNGSIDELRIHNGVVGPESFLHHVRSGFVVIVE